MKSNHQHINQDSGDVEYYTPIEIVNAARTVMGSIDLDPASSPIANERVKAVKFFSSNGLGQDWFGNVWMNHPFDRFENPKWIAKIVSEFNRGHIKQACCITFASTSEKWFQPLLNFPQCFLHPRTNYFLPDGTLKKGVTKGSVVTYLTGGGIQKFAETFNQFGVCK